MNILLLSPYPKNETLKKFFQSRGDKVTIFMEELAPDVLRSQQVDYIISFSYPHIISEQVISLYKDRIINLEDAFLPVVRCKYPGLWCLFEGKPNGISLFFIDSGIDSGDLIFQEEITFSEDDTLSSSYQKRARALEKLLMSKWEHIVSGVYQKKNQKEMSQLGFRRWKKHSDCLLELFPEKWTTPISDVQRAGAEFEMTRGFWKQYSIDIDLLSE